MLALQNTRSSTPPQLPVLIPHLDGYDDRISFKKYSLEMTGQLFNLLYKYTKGMIFSITKTRKKTQRGQVDLTIDWRDSGAVNRGVRQKRGTSISIY